MSYYFLLDLAMIILSTKLLGLITRKIEMPQVVGALLSGLILGPAGLNVLHSTDFLTQVSELGVIILMFTAGLETDVSELAKSGKISLAVAVLGVLLPLFGGFAVASFFNTGTDTLLQNVFIGVILTATSVSITVETLKELGKLSSRSGNIILGAALIDDVLGVVALTIVMGLAEGNVNVAIVLGKIIAFFLISGVVGFFIHKRFDLWTKKSSIDRRRFTIIAFAFCLVYAFVAEEFFGVADITGAFVAGLMIAKTARSNYVTHRIDILGYLFFTPVFFASIGLMAVIPELTSEVIGFSIIITLVAILTKVIGCGLGAKAFKLPNQSALRIGVGMISRGEVALIIASKGAMIGIMKEEFFTPIILMVITTTIITPILLKIVYREKNYTTVYADKALADTIFPEDIG